MLDNYSIGILGLIVTIIGSAVTIAALFYSFRIEKKRRKEELLRQQRFSWENIYEGIIHRTVTRGENVKRRQGPEI